MKNGKCIIFSAPSGAGKTTIVHHLLEKKFPLEFSISACSRSPRANEKEGEDYYFLGVEGFKQKIAEDAFIEWEEVYPDHFYGTLKSEVERIWNNGNAVIFDVDVIGGLNIKKKFGKDALAIFVQAPSLTALEHRLRSRSTETEEKIQLRIEKAEKEVKFASKFDRILVNDTLEKAFIEAENILSDFLKK
ncbi:MAG: guanylate kinase [Crocinitomicaceae bacterium]